MQGPAAAGQAQAWRTCCLLPTFCICSFPKQLSCECRCPALATHYCWACPFAHMGKTRQKINVKPYQWEAIAYAQLCRRIWAPFGRCVSREARFWALRRPVSPHCCGAAECCLVLPWAAVFTSWWWWVKDGTWVVVPFLSSQIQPLFLWRWDRASTEQLDFILSVSTGRQISAFFGCMGPPKSYKDITILSLQV